MFVSVVVSIGLPTEAVQPIVVGKFQVLVSRFCPRLSNAELYCLFLLFIVYG